MTYQTILLKEQLFTTNIHNPFSPLQHARNLFNEEFSFFFQFILSTVTMDEISHEDELIAQFAGVASVPASEVTLLASQILCFVELFD